MGEVEKRIDTALKQAVRQRNYRRCRDRALTRLSAKYKTEYLELLAEEKSRDEEEQKAWLDISGRTNASLGVSTHNRESGEDAQGFSNQGKARNLAGKE